MRTVTVRMHAADLSSQMAAMRDWLDYHRYAPTRFVYDQTDNALVISVEFPNDLEGEAFARRFDGQEPRQPLPGDLLCGETAPPLLQPVILTGPPAEI
jgi:hypothetical protein